MNYTKVLLILGVVAAFAYVATSAAVGCDNDKSDYTEKSSNCTKRHRETSTFTKKNGDTCKCLGRSSPAIGRGKAACNRTAAATTTTAGTTTTTAVPTTASTASS